MATEDARKLFVAGLPESITEDVLRGLFEATGGTVVNVSLPRDRATGRPRGFGFVTLSSAEEAHSARQSLDGSLQAGRAISVRPFQSEPPKRGEPRAESVGPTPAASEDRTLYVGNLPYDTTQAEVEALFSENGAGPIVRIHLPTGPDGRLRGFGFVTLGSAESANAAIVALREVDVRGRRLMINIAHPRDRGGPGGGPGGPGDRMRSARPMRDEGHEPRPFDRFSEPMPAPGGGGGAGGFGGDSSRPVEGRRARTGGGGERSDRGGGGGGGGGGADWDAEKKKQKKKKRGGAAVETKKERGGGGNFRNWEDWDED